MAGKSSAQQPGDQAMQQLSVMRWYVSAVGDSCRPVKRDQNAAVAMGVVVRSVTGVMEQV